MAAKPEIQYVGQFYIYGSEAKKLEPKRQERKKTAVLEQPKTEQTRVISVDPVALIGLVVAAAMLICLAVCAAQICDTWQEYESVSNYLTQLMMENASLKHQYDNSFDLAEVEAAALALGMIPATEANTIILPVHIPAAEPEPTFWEDLVWFAQGLFA